jgi:hypothetical protein
MLHEARVTGFQEDADIIFQSGTFEGDKKGVDIDAARGADSFFEILDPVRDMQPFPGSAASLQFGNFDGKGGRVAQVE